MKYTLLFGLCLFCLSVYSWNIEDLDPFADKETSFFIKERKVKDMEAYRRVLADSVKKYEDELNNAGQLKDGYDRLRSLVGGNISDKEDLELAEFIVRYISYDDPRLASKIEKDLNKGKLNEKIFPVLDKFISRASRREEKARKKVNDIKNFGAERYFRGTFSYPEKIEYDTVVNPYRREEIFISGDKRLRYMYSKISAVEHLKGWEWVCDETPETIHEEYPEYVTYSRYASHPQYRIIRNLVFDNNGKLVYVLFHDNDNELEYIDYIKQIQKAAFSEEINAYDIRNADALTLEYLREYFSVNDWGQIYGAAQKWLNQIKYDFRDAREIPYITYREGPCSFRTVYVDSVGDEVLNITVDYDNVYYKVKYMTKI